MLLTSQIANNYTGTLISSGSRDARVNVKVEPLSNLLVKITFSDNRRTYKFRAMLSERDEGFLMTVQNRVTDHYILSGKSGFLYKKNTVHGGYLHALGSFYFHVVVERFSGKREEFYFIGKTLHSLRTQRIDLSSHQPAGSF